MPERYLSSILKPSSTRRSLGLKPVVSKVSRNAHLQRRSSVSIHIVGIKVSIRMLTWFRPLVQWPVPLDRTSVSCLWTSRLVTDIRRFVEHGISTAQSIGYSDKVYPCEEDVARESNMRCLNELSNRSAGSSSSSSSQVTQAGGKFETSLTSTFLELCRRSKQVLLTSKPPSIPFICDGIVLGEKKKKMVRKRER